MTSPLKMLLQVVPALVFAGCVGVSSQARTTPQAALVKPTGAQSTTSVRRPGAEITGFAKVMRSTTIDGRAIAADSRPIAMVFFASWCSHCRQELADLGTLRQRYPELRVIGLNAYEEYRNFSDRNRLRTFIAANAPWLKEIVSAGPDMRASFGNIPKIPSLFVFRGNGELVAEFRRNRAAPPSMALLARAIESAKVPSQVGK